MIRVALAPIALIGLGACAASSERPPIARIAADPAAIAFHDDFQTTVTLDGTASAAVEDPSEPLTFVWHLFDDDAQADDVTQPTLTARFAGERPPRVVLEVTTSDGRSGNVTRELLLTVLASP
ncbi:MAG TPA: hypothetical protein VGO00_25195 [Kofleriaceae bacterium]|nr:hypothetical protein [Kofleriaceae bacterium]